MANQNQSPNLPNEPVNAPKDPQEQYDEDLLEYTDGQAVEADDAGPHGFKGRFPRDFYRYSQDFHDREDGAPGTDQDFGVTIRSSGEKFRVPKLMPEGDGDAESAPDREVREEIMDVLSRDEGLEAGDVSARVEDGVVTLSGSVDEAAMRKKIEEAVATVPGVDEVTNCLIVNPRADLLDLH
ncbi:MAG: BON domain-containing protein [Bdellovibrionales bacterium]|nr:BON domain-containing protein [Bdellovibrionales bacterium]